MFHPRITIREHERQGVHHVHASIKTEVHLSGHPANKVRLRVKAADLLGDKVFTQVRHHAVRITDNAEFLKRCIKASAGHMTADVEALEAVLNIIDLANDLKIAGSGYKDGDLHKQQPKK